MKKARGSYQYCPSKTCGRQFDGATSEAYDERLIERASQGSPHKVQPDDMDGLV